MQIFLCIFQNEIWFKFYQNVFLRDQISVLVVNYGISNTTVLEIP